MPYMVCVWAHDSVAATTTRVLIIFIKKNTQGNARTRPTTTLSKTKEPRTATATADATVEINVVCVIYTTVLQHDKFDDGSLLLLDFFGNNFIQFHFISECYGRVPVPVSV